MSGALIGAAAVVLAAVLASPFLTTWAQRREARRMASGTVATSTADTLWKANQDLISSQRDMIAAKDAEIAKLIEQRDRLVAALDEKVVPALEGLAATQRHDGEMLAGNARMLDDILGRLEGGGHGLASPVQRG